MKICFFGTYEKNYSRNKIIFRGLEENKVNILEVNAPLKQTKLDNPKHLGILAIVSRIGRKLRFFPVLMKNIFSIKKSEAIFIGYPGHLDVPVGYVVARLLHKPLIFDPTFSLHNVFVNDYRILSKDSLFSKALKRAETIIFNLPDTILADTPLQLDFYQRELKLPSSKLRVLPIGADDKIYKRTVYHNKDKSKLNVVYYGLYNPLHGVEYILEAARLFKDKNTMFIMVGNGQTYPDSIKYAEKHNLTNVQFFPDMTEKNAMGTLSSADIFMGFFQNSPTVFRSIPNKVFQGIAMGKVVLTADSPAIKSVFTHKMNIYLCKPADAKSIVKALKELQKNPSLREKISRNAYNLFVDQFTPKAIGKQLIEIVRKALTEKGGTINQL